MEIKIQMSLCHVYRLKDICITLIEKMNEDTLISPCLEQSAQVKKVRYDHVYAFITVVLCAVGIIDP